MRLPTCWCCLYKFKWKELLLKLKKVECPICGVQQHITKRKQRQTQVLTLILSVITMMGIQFFYSYSVIGTFFYGAIMLLITLFISPYLLEFTEKKGHLF